jgi:hypothetical protein
MGDGPVANEVRRNEDCFWAQTLGPDRGHRRTHAKTPRLVGSRTDDGPVSPPCDYNWFATQLGIVALLHRGIERVHIHVNDLANHDVAIHHRLGFTKKRKLAVFGESITLERPARFSDADFMAEWATLPRGPIGRKRSAFFFAFGQIDSSCTISSSININLASPHHPQSTKAHFW